MLFTTSVRAPFSTHRSTDAGFLLVLSASVQWAIVTLDFPDTKTPGVCPSDELR